MNRTTLLVLALIIVGVGGYLLMGQGDETPEPVAETIGNPDETAGTTAGAETDDAGEMTEAGGDMPADADAAEETADIAEPVTDVAEDAAEAAGTDAMEGAADARRKRRKRPTAVQWRPRRNQRKTWPKPGTKRQMQRRTSLFPIT